MSWIEALSPALAAEVARLAMVFEDAGPSVLQFAAETAADNLKTVELTVDYFEELGSATAQELRLLQSTRRKLALETAACLLLYWVALGREEQKEDGEERVGTHSGVQEGP